MSLEAEFDGKIEIIGTIKGKEVVVKLKVNGKCEWNQTRMLILSMIGKLTNFYDELVKRTKQ